MRTINQIACDVVSQYQSHTENEKDLFFQKNIPAAVIEKFNIAFPGTMNSERKLLYLDSTSAVTMWGGSQKYGTLLTSQAIYSIRKNDASVVLLDKLESIYTGPSNVVVNDQIQLDIYPTQKADAIFYNIITHIVRDSLGPAAECPIDNAIFFPKVCIGCGKTTTLVDFEIPVYGKLRSTTGSNLIQSYVMGAALLGGFVFSAMGVSLIDSLKKRDIKNRYLFPICESCKKGLSKQELNTYSQPLVSDPAISATIYGNRLFWLQVTSSKFALWTKNSKFLSAFRDRNIERFDEDTVSQGFPSVLLEEIRKSAGNDITEMDARMIHCWRTHINPIKGIVKDWYYEPDIPQQKLDKAKVKYAPIPAGEVILGFKDISLFGSVKGGMIITTSGLYWLLEGSGKGQIKYKDIQPQNIKSKSSFPTDKIILGDGLDFMSVHFGAGSDQYTPFVAFLINASLLVSTDS